MIITWTAAYHHELTLSKTELLFIPGKDCPPMGLSVMVEDITVSPSSTAWNLGVTLDKGLSCTPNITSVARSWRFALYNIGRIQSLPTKDTTQLLVQALQLLLGLLQLALSWTPSLCDYTVAAYPLLLAQLLPPSLRANTAHSAKSPLFSVLAHQWWNELVGNNSPSSAPPNTLDLQV